MKKALIQLLITVTLFFGMWYSFAQIDWLGLFRIDPYEWNNDHYNA